MADTLLSTLRGHPEIALFLTLAAGYLIGKIKLGGHALGLVTGALFAGLLMGQLAIEIKAGCGLPDSGFSKLVICDSLGPLKENDHGQAASDRVAWDRDLP